jgi:hypothetical protein
MSEGAQVLALGPDLQILVSESGKVTEKGNTFYRQCLQVMDARGATPEAWRLPRKDDLPDPSGPWQYQHVLADGVILMFSQNTGEV